MRVTTHLYVSVSFLRGLPPKTKQKSQQQNSKAVVFLLVSLKHCHKKGAYPPRKTKKEAPTRRELALSASLRIRFSGFQVRVDGQKGRFTGPAAVAKTRPLFFSVGCVTQAVWGASGGRFKRGAGECTCTHSLSSWTFEPLFGFGPF